MFLYFFIRYTSKKRKISDYKKEIKELTDFLPLLYDENIELSKSPKKGTTDLGGGFYVYHPTVNTFFELAGQEHWKDYQYVDNFSEND